LIGGPLPRHAGPGEANFHSRNVRLRADNESVSPETSHPSPSDRKLSAQSPFHVKRRLRRCRRRYESPATNPPPWDLADCGRHPDPDHESAHGTPRKVAVAAHSRKTRSKWVTFPVAHGVVPRDTPKPAVACEAHRTGHPNVANRQGSPQREAP